MRALREITLPDMSGGLNTHDPDYDIADNQSPDMLNLWYKDKALRKRPGQAMVITNLPHVHCISEEYNGFRIVHAGTKLYRWDEAGARYYKGVFNASRMAYYSPSLGDYYTVPQGATIDGVPYAAGDRIVYYPSDPQTETATVTGNVTTGGTMHVTVTAAGISGSPLEIGITLKTGCTAEEAAGIIRSSLSKNTALCSLYVVEGEYTDITLRQIEPGTYDDSLNISIARGTCDGIGEAPDSKGMSMWHNAIEELDSDIADHKGLFIEFGDMMYYIDGTEIWQINASWRVEKVKPYEPIIMLNCRPDLSESTNCEPFNLLGPGFCVKYNGDAKGTSYYVSELLDERRFKIEDLNRQPVDITSDGTLGWKVRKTGGDWLTGSQADGTYDALTVPDNGLIEGDIVEFDPNIGVLPGGIISYGLAVYKLPLSELDDEPVKVVVDGEDKEEGTHYIYDKDAGTVVFPPGNIPGTGTNNVWITAYKTVPGNKNKITGCKAAVAFGGESGGLAGGTRVFLTANPAYPLSHWHSDLGLHVGSGMRYFPDTFEEFLDQNSEPITTVAKMGRELVVFKKNSIFAMRYAYDGQDAYFPVRECNNSVGCDIPGSVQLIDNKLVFANTRTGVHMLISTSNEAEELVKPLSANINSILLQEANLESACSCDYERYYWLCVNGKVYLWDYEQTPYYNYSDYEKAQKRLAWYRFDNIYSEIFCIGQTLYQSAARGIAGLTTVKDDFGIPYEAYFFSKTFDLGCPEELKTFMFAYPSFLPDGNIEARVTVGNEDMEEIVSRDFVIGCFGWDNWNWSAFTWDAIKYGKTFSMRLGIKNVSHVQIKVSGCEAGKEIGLSGLRITYYTNRKVKR